MIVLFWVGSEIETGVRCTRSICRVLLILRTSFLGSREQSLGIWYISFRNVLVYNLTSSGGTNLGLTILEPGGRKRGERKEGEFLDRIPA